MLHAFQRCRTRECVTLSIEKCLTRYVQLPLMSEHSDGAGSKLVAMREHEVMRVTSGVSIYA